MQFFLALFLGLTQLPGEVPVRVPPELSTQAANVALAVARAQGRVDRFAQDYGWEGLLREPLPYDSVEIVSTTDDLKRRVLELNQLPPDTPLPSGTLVAALENRVLLAVTPAEYARLQPEQAARLNGFEKLLAHEIAHRLHVAVLEGNEEAMGPRWFYEGFAVVAAGQHEDVSIQPQQAPDAMKAQTYAQYGALVRLLMTRAPLPEIVRQAGRPDFETWVLEQL